MTREIERRFAQRLARQRAGEDGGAARLCLTLDDQHAFAKKRCLRRSFFSGGPRPDDDQIVCVLFAHALLDVIGSRGPGRANAWQACESLAFPARNPRQRVGMVSIGATTLLLADCNEKSCASNVYVLLLSRSESSM